MPQVISYFGRGNDAGDHSFLSNFYRHCDGPTVEHHFQAAKAVRPADAARILAAAAPGEAKRLGRSVELRPGWDDQRLVVMRTLLRTKFFGYPDMGDRLLATYDAVLIEGNTWGDRFWGQVDGRGENWLGRLLMQVRAELLAAHQHRSTV